MSSDSYQAMLAAVQAFHNKHDFKHTGGEELTYRIALMTEELGEIAEAETNRYWQRKSRICSFY